MAWSVDSRTALPSGATHSAHFNSAFQSGFTQFNVALATQLASAPLPSPASGFTYGFDPDLGVFNRSTVSFGPIFTERAETIGAKRFSTGATFQEFRFDTIEGVDLDRVPAVFTHDGFEQGGGRGDLVTTTNAIDARVSQFVAFLTYGLTDSLDVSLAVPLVNTDLTVVSDSVVRRIGTTDPETHFFNTSSDDVGDRRIFTAFGIASGIGDLTIRLKQTVKRSGWGAMALALDVRLPTGDEEQLPGSGAPGIKPFLIWSNSYGIVSPHVNAAYEWNGSSILAGNPETGESGHLADRALLAFGADLGVSSRFTLAFDILGQWFIDTPQLVTQGLRGAERRGVPRHHVPKRDVQRVEWRDRLQAQRRARAADRRERTVLAERHRAAHEDHADARRGVRLRGSLPRTTTADKQHPRSRGERTEGQSGKRHRAQFLPHVTATRRGHSLLGECGHRIDPGRTARRDGTSDHRDDGQQQRDAPHHHRIARLDSEELALETLAQGECAASADQKA